MTAQNKELLATLCLAVFTFGIYLLALNAPFYLDDRHMIVENIFIKNPHYFGWLWKGYVTSSSVPKGMCRPILMLTFIFNYLSAGLAASGYRVVNILLHFLNGMLLYSLLKLIRPSASKLFLFLISAAFIAHPLNTEAVIYISSRSDLLTALFSLSAMILWIKKKPIFALSLYALALLTKETALCLPMLFFAWETLQARPLKEVFDKKHSRLWTALILITLLYFVYRITIFGRTPTTPPRGALSNVWVQFAVTFIYGQLFFLLTPLNLMHDVPNFTGIFHADVIAGILLTAGLAYYGIKQRKEMPMAAFGIAWFLLSLTPKFYAKLIYPAMEHHAYIPLLGIYILFAVLLEKYFRQNKKYFLYAALTIIAVLSLATALRCMEYKDPMVFWQISAKRAPKTGIGHNYLGLEYVNKNMGPEAKEEFLKVIALADSKETAVMSRLNLARILNAEKKYTAALALVEEAERAADIVPEGANHMRGIIYMSMGKKEKAAKAWSQEINDYPDSYETVLDMGIYYFGINDMARAQKLFDRSIFLKPEAYLGYYGLAQVMEKQGNLKRAAELYHYALTLNPRDAAASYFLGSVLSRLGNDKAVYYLQMAIGLNPKLCEARNDLAVVYASLKVPRWDLAKNEIKTAQENGCKANPDLTALVEKNAPKE